MLNRLIPRDEQFFDLFNQLAEHLKTAAGLLNQLFADPSRMTELVKQIKDVEHHLGHAVRISAVLPTFYDGRTRLAREVLETLQGHFKTKCLEPIRHNTRLAEAPANRKTIFEYAPDSHGAEDYRRVVDFVAKEVTQQPLDTSRDQVVA